MAQELNAVPTREWKVDQQCEIYSLRQRRWIKGKVIDIFKDAEGEWVKVQCDRNTLEMPPNDKHLRTIIFGGGELKWHNVVEAVKQELYPTMATWLGESIKELLSSDTDTVKPGDFSDNATESVIERLKTKKVLFNKEIEYIKELVQRANAFRWKESESMVLCHSLFAIRFNISSDCNMLFESDGAISDALNRFKNDNDLNLKFSGLTTNLLIDIYSVHKALMFGQFRFTKYEMNHFINDVHRAEERVFGEDTCSPIIKEQESAFNVSFHPYYVINDDMFEVMAFHFAVSSMVNRLDQQHGKDNGLTIRSIVIPTSITSIYDPEIEHNSSIEHLSDHLNEISPSNHRICRRIEPNINDIESMSNVLSKMYQRLECDDPTDIVIVLNRRRGKNAVHLFECNDDSKILNLYRNYFIGFDFNVQWQLSDATDGDGDSAPNRLVRCWMTFGINQRLRFYPEYLLWIVPRLFARSDTMTASEMIKRLYDAEYKWGWRVCLDDPVFNRFYHIITEYEHITNNYNRNDMHLLSKRESECGLRDHLEHKLDRNLNLLFEQLVEEQAFDSDAILEDSLAEKRVNDGRNSNIFRSLNASGLGLRFRALTHSLLRYQGTICCSDNVQSVEECPWLEDLIVDMQRLQECHMKVDATNIWQFDLESIVNSWSHIISVHRLLSEDDDQKETKQQIQSHVLERVQCEKGTKCTALKIQKQRRRETTGKQRVEVEPDAVTAECESVEEGLFGIHCQIFHGQNEQKRSEPSDDEQTTESRFKMQVSTTTTTAEPTANDESKEEDTVNETPVAIDFGRSVLCWLSAEDSPRFDTLRNELISNPQSTIDLMIFDRLRKWAIARSQENDDTVDESLGLKAYSDTNDFQAALSRAHWESASQDDRRSFYQWAMTLYRVHLRSAVPIPPATASSTTPRPLYTGMSIVLSLGHELGAYYGPLSTTTSKSVASGFSGGKGQIYKYGSSYINPLRCTVGIDMQSISCYPQEHEIMLYHSVVPIASTVTQDDSPDVLVNHLLFSLQSRPTPIVRREAFFKKLGIRWTSSWIPLILSHKLLTAKTKYKNRTVRYRLGDEIQIPTFMMMHLLAPNNPFSSKQLSVVLNSTDRASELMLSFTDDTDDILYFTKYVVVENNSQQIQLSESEVKIFGLTVFAKASNQSPPDLKLGRFASNIYAFEGEEPLVILKALKVPVCKPETSVGGMLEIRYSSDIVIAAEGAIDGSGTRLIGNEQIQRMQRYQKEMELKDRMQASCRFLSGDNFNVDHKDNGDDKEDDDDQDVQDVLYAIGGDMRLISKTAITNSGILQSDPSHNNVLVGATIHIEANSFVNQGTVQCINGSVDVHCTKYVNTGIIRPIPDIFIKNGSNNLLATNLQFESEFLISLSLYDHHGHAYGDVGHPNNLLVDSADSYYYSAKWCTVSDWVIFKVNHRATIKPTAVSIRNMDYEAGIKTIALYMGRDTGDWIKICKDITGIHNNNTEPQRFELSLIVSDEELMKLRADLIFVEVVSNHGSRLYNCFYSFQVFGCPVST